MPRICQCCGTADISHRPHGARYCLECRNSGLVLAVPSRARAFTSALVKLGALPRADSQVCTDCGAPAEHYDHRDYVKPWEVDPVCAACNLERGPGANRFPWLATPTTEAQKA